MKAICDKGCKKEYELETLEEFKHSKGIIQAYFTCPYCNRKYTVCFTDRSIRAKQARLRQLQAMEGMNTANPVEELKLSIKREMSNLKARMLDN